MKTPFGDWGQKMSIFGELEVNGPTFSQVTNMPIGFFDVFWVQYQPYYQHLQNIPPTSLPRFPPTKQILLGAIALPEQSRAVHRTQGIHSLLTSRWTDVEGSGNGSNRLDGWMVFVMFFFFKILFLGIF